MPAPRKQPIYTPGMGGLTPIELARIVDLREASRLSGVSPDTLKRRYSDRIIHLSPRRLGMRLRDALLLTESEPSAA